MEGLPRQVLEKLLIKYQKMEDIIETIDPEIIDDEEDLITPEDEETEEEETEEAA